MNTVSIRFPGRALERGFWLYVVDLAAPNRRVLYVGRTGDSSSSNASSPFARIGQHLDLRPHAKGNALLRNLRAAGVDPSNCEIEMTAIGPLFPEEPSFDLHKPIRDRVASLEAGLADHLRSRGFEVLGTHGHFKAGDPVLAEVIAAVDSKFDDEP